MYRRAGDSHDGQRIVQHEYKEIATVDLPG